MTLAPGQKAKTYAQGKIARGGNTRGAYRPATAFLSVAGVQLGTRKQDPNARVLLESLAVIDQLDAPNTCAFTMLGRTPTVGQDVILTIGSINTLTRLFAGEILNIVQVQLADDPRNVAYQVNAIDYMWLLDRRRVFARYTNQSGTAIAQDLIARFTQGFTAKHVQTGLDVLDEITFTNTSVSEALAQLAKRVGGYYYVDYQRDLHLYVGDESLLATTPPIPLTPTHASMRHLSVRRDLSQIVTRAYQEGGGVAVLANISPGETMIPVVDGAWYNPTGGRIACGPQRIRYTAMRIGDDGALLGPGVSPGAAPTLALADGSGLYGRYDYAYTWVTATGETRPSPLGTIIVTGTPLAPPASPPTGYGVGAGEGPESGDYTYALTFKTAVGETTLSSFSPSQHTYDVPGPTNAPSVVESSYVTPNLTVGATYGYMQAWQGFDGTSYKETPPGPPVYITLAQAPGNPAGYVRMPAVSVTFFAMPGLTNVVTSVYRNKNGGPWTRIFNAAGSPIYDSVSDAEAAGMPGLGSLPAMIANRVNFSGVPLGPSNVIARVFYRWRSGGDGLFHKVGEIADNTTTTFTDTTKNANIGPVAPSSNTATTARVLVSGVAVGPSTVTARRIYRTPANGTQLKLLSTFLDNVTTTLPTPDGTADASLGANAPTNDTSGITPPGGGQILPGATEVLTSGATFADADGGWAIIGNGQQVIRYHGISGNTLTGVPASGPGSVTSPVNYGASITAAYTLVGIPVSGDGAILVPILQGDQANLLVVQDDLDAQALLASLTGGDGVQEAYAQDNRLSETEALARAQALLALRNQIDEALSYTSRDLNTRSGATQHADFPAPTSVSGDYKIQAVTIAQFQFPDLLPTCTVEASSERYSFEDLLRLARFHASTPL